MPKGTLTSSTKLSNVFFKHSLHIDVGERDSSLADLFRASFSFLDFRPEAQFLFVASTVWTISFYTDSNCTGTLRSIRSIVVGHTCLDVTTHVWAMHDVDGDVICSQCCDDPKSLVALCTWSSCIPMVGGDLSSFSGTTQFKW